MEMLIVSETRVGASAASEMPVESRYKIPADNDWRWRW